MHVYLFTGWISRFHAGRVADDCVSHIVCGGDPDEARGRFEQWLVAGGGGNEAVPTKVEKIVGARFVDKLFTESGPAPVDWREVAVHAASVEYAEAGDDFEQGYWVDVNRLIRPERLSASVEALRADLPEEIAAGLNWSPGQTFFFLLSALSPPPPPGDDRAAAAPGASEGPDETVASGGFSWTELREREAAFPELAVKTVAVLIEARNSVVATWLWRRFVARTQLAANDIRIDPWCGIMGPADAVGDQRA